MIPKPGSEWKWKVLVFEMHGRCQGRDTNKKMKECRGGGMPKRTLQIHSVCTCCTQYQCIFISFA